MADCRGILAAGRGAVGGGEEGTRVLFLCRSLADCSATRNSLANREVNRYHCMQLHTQMQLMSIPQLDGGSCGSDTGCLRQAPRPASSTQYLAVDCIQTQQKARGTAGSALTTSSMYCMLSHLRKLCIYPASPGVLPFCSTGMGTIQGAQVVLECQEL